MLVDVRRALRQRPADQWRIHAGAGGKHGWQRYGGGSTPETAFNGGTPLAADQFNPGSNRGISPLDQRMRLVASAVWEPRWGVCCADSASVAARQAETGRPVAAIISVASIPFPGRGRKYV